MNLIFIFLFLLFAWNAEATVYTAASCSTTDINAKLALAVTGDEVDVPDGPCTWSSGLTAITKGIVLSGTGNPTHITVSSAEPIQFNATSDLPFRLTGFYFTISGAYAAVSVNPANGLVMTQVRIDHNTFINGAKQIKAGWHGILFGVIDHNQFTNGNESIFVSGDSRSKTSGDAIWNNYAITTGTANALFIENNTFTWNNSIGTQNEMVYHQNGARTVIRYNTFDGTAFTNGATLFIDSHGNDYYYNTNTNAYRGQPLVEIYNNDFHANNTYRVMYMRGGSVVIHDNTIEYDSGNRPGVFQFTDEECWLTAHYSPLRSTWPAQDQVFNSFIWNNTVNGVSDNAITLGNACDSTFFQQDRDYFLHAPQASGGSESFTGRAGGSTSAPTQTDTGNMTFSASGANAYYPYTTYIYPHPLIAPPPSGLVLTPTSPIVSFGNVGGPFNNSSQAYVLSNTAGGTRNWTATATQNWVTVSATSGAISGTNTNPAETNTVTVSINSNANSLGSGTYNDVVTWTNTTDHVGDTTTSITLTVNLVGGGGSEVNGRITVPIGSRPSVSGRISVNGRKEH